MQYQTSGDLPECVRKHLPQHAQTLYLKAYNLALDQYASASSRGSETREETANKIAWSAVRNIYQKDEKSGTWTLRRSTELQQM